MGSDAGDDEHGGGLLVARSVYAPYGIGVGQQGPHASLPDLPLRHLLLRFPRHPLLLLLHPRPSPSLPSQYPSRRRRRPPRAEPAGAHLRKMVQRVTSVRLDGDLAEPLVKPEPVRPAVVGARAVLQQTHLPTLDTSAFLLERDEGSSLGPAADVPASDFDGLLPAFSSLGSWSVM
ncbi:hypothetical protein BHM03_00047867 [Ensete ventricosum]|nr:hypothetical protein BHM03_00047867 [Ensete ventricosum]